MKSTYLDWLMLTFFDLFAKTPSEFQSLPFSIFCLVLYFLQTLSSLFQLHYDSLMNTDLSFFTKLAFYSNFANVLTIVRNTPLFMFIYIIVLLILLTPFLFIVIYSVIRLYFANRFDNKLVYCVKIMKFWLFCFEFVLILPFLEVLIRTFDCQTSDSKDSEYFHCGNSPFQSNIHMFATVSGIFLAYFLGFLLILTNRNYYFGFRALNFEPSVISFSIFTARCLSVLLQPIFINMGFFCYVLLHLISVLLFFEYFSYKSIGNNYLKRVFLGFLCGFECVLILMTMQNYIGTVNNDNIMYFFLILITISMKLGFKIGENLENQRIMINSNDFMCFDDNLSFLRSEFIGNSNSSFFQGFFLNHYRRKCFEETCLAQKEEFFPSHKENSSFNSQIFMKNLDLFIKRNLNSFINNKALKGLEERNFELIFKYIDFLSISCDSTLLLLYDYEKIKRRFKKQPFFVHFLLKWLNVKIREKILADENRLELNNESYIDLNNYFKFVKNKRKFENMTNEILHEKRKFWTLYLNSGFKKMSSLIQSLRLIYSKIHTFEKKLLTYSLKNNSNVLVLKLYSILYCLFYNDMDKALKYEGEFDNGLNIERAKVEKSVNKISFLNKEIVTCETSFLNLDGLIKPISKSEKFGRVFGYSKNEIPNISRIEQLMPEFISKYHNKFIENYLADQKNSDCFADKCVRSFALHKNRYIFPISMYFGVCFSYQNDFVLIAAIVPDKKDQMAVLFLDSGEIIGVSLEMKNFIVKKFNDEFLSENLESILAFDLFAELKSLIVENSNGEEISRNHKTVLSLPILRKQDADHSQSVISSKTSRYKALLKQSLYTNPCKRFEVTFDLTIINYKISSTQKLNCFYLNVQYVSKQLKTDTLTLLEFNKDFKKNLGSETLIPLENQNLETENVPPTEKISNQERQYPHNITANLHAFNDDENVNNSVNEFQEKNESSNFSKPIKENNQFSMTQNEKTLTVTEPKLETTKGKDKEPEKKSPFNEIKGGSEEKEEIIKESSKINEVNDQKIDKNPEPIPNLVESTSNKVKTIEIFSKHSSAMKIKSNNFRVFKSISAIKENVPLPFYLFFLGIFFELLLIIIYTIVVQLSESDYFQLKYSPTKLGMINFCRLYSSFSFSTAITIEFEYLSLHMQPPNPTYNQQVMYFRIMNRSFYEAKDIVYAERNSPPELSYQSIYRNYMTDLINFDYTPKILEPVTYFELLDFYLAYLQYLEEEPDVYNANYDFLIFLQRNFPYYLVPSAAIFAEIQDGFTSYNDDTNSSLQNILIIFLLLMVLLKFFEMLQLNFLHNYILRILSIFLRTNAKDVVKELIFLDQTIDELKEKNEDYFYSSFAYKCLERQHNYKEMEQAKTSFSQRVNNMDRKSKKFRNNRNIKSLTQFSNILIIITTLSLSFCFYFFNFYYWLVVNSNIKELISINISFASIYVYSSSILTCNNNLLRERIITNNTSYESIPNATYQDPTSRINFFNAAINKRLPLVTSVAQNDLPTRIFQAESYISDPNFEQLTQKDVCELLYKLGDIEADEMVICQTIWTQSLTKGLLIGINYYLEMLQQLADFRNSSSDPLQQQQEILNYIADWNHTELFMGDYFLNLGLYLFYQYINNYYDYIISNSIYMMEVLLITTMVVFSGINFLVWILIWRYFKRFFKVLGSSLFLMPYEKITEDEATFQIINSFLK